jgi:hypothetical protein
MFEFYDNSNDYESRCYGRDEEITGAEADEEISETWNPIIIKATLNN